MTLVEPMCVLVDRLLRRWSTAGVKIRPGATVAEIRDFEERSGVQLPDDMLEFYRAVDGMEKNDLDPLEQVRFWPISEIVSVSEELSENQTAGGCPGFFLFADYSLWAHGYAIDLRRSDAGVQTTIVVGSDDPIEVASCFSDFIRKYLDDPQRLFVS